MPMGKPIETQFQGSALEAKNQIRHLVNRLYERVTEGEMLLTSCREVIKQQQAEIIELKEEIRGYGFLD